MRHYIPYLAACIITLSLLGGTRPAMAQEDDSKPKPAARTYPPPLVADQDAASDQASTDTLNPDIQPLTGVQTPTLGTPEIRHSYWVPGFEYGNFVRSNTISQPTTSGCGRGKLRRE